MKIHIKASNSLFGPDTYDISDAILPYIGNYYNRITDWTGYCVLKMADLGKIANIVWSDNETDQVFWDEDTLVIMPAHGIPRWAHTATEADRAIKWLFSDGLVKKD